MILIRGDCSGTIWYKLLHLLSTRSYFLAGALEVFIKPIRITSHSIHAYGEYVCVVSSWYSSLSFAASAKGWCKSHNKCMIENLTFLLPVVSILVKHKRHGFQFYNTLLSVIYDCLSCNKHSVWHFAGP